MSGEQLAHPAARSMSLPFDALLAGPSSDDEDNNAADDDAALAALSRRFSSDSAVAGSASASAIADASCARAAHSRAAKPSRRERVRALTQWYDRMSSRQRASTPSNARHFASATSARAAIRADSWGYGAEDVVHIGSSFADRRDDTRKAGTSVLQQEIERLRLELSAERAQKMCLEQTTSSLQNALSFSKKKVNEQQETISRLEGDVRRAQSLAPCLKEILSVTERHYGAKELALKRVIQGLSAERDAAVEVSQRVDAMTQRARPRSSSVFQ